MTFIRFRPESAEQAPVLQPVDLLRDFATLHFPFYSNEKAESNQWSPALDLHEDGEAFIVTMEAPGLQKDVFKISYHDGVLHIAGERCQEKERNYFHRERSFGHFARSVSLPADVNADQIAAVYRDGVLTVRLPKAERAKPKQIEVSVN